jgi:23S rRNA (uracil1939-C5)-methyltransferase
MKRWRPSADPGQGEPGPQASAFAERHLTMAAIGVRGDAVAHGPDGPVYVAGLLPGEEARVNVAGERGLVVERLNASAERIAPACRHFGKCGGCQLQHWAPTPQAAWKRAQLVEALRRRGLDVAVDPIVTAFGAGRRRAAFHAQRRGKNLSFGFMARGGAQVTDMAECPVMEASLVSALSALRAIGAAYAPARGEITIAVLATQAGLDVQVKGAGVTLDAAGFARAAALAEAGDLARLSFDADIAIARRQPFLTMGHARVQPPPGAFVQATAAAEDILAQLALDAISGAERAADLFCGIGTFALRAAAFAEVLAVEGDSAMLAALDKAADGAAGAIKQVRTQRRDLLRTPIAALELKKIDAVIFDPPRSGARMQAEQIAASKVAKAAAVSCDVVTFARDARVLVDGGFRLVKVTPVDQFQYSPHLEIVGAFAR